MSVIRHTQDNLRVTVAMLSMRLCRDGGSHPSIRQDAPGSGAAAFDSEAVRDGTTDAPCVRQGSSLYRYDGYEVSVCLIQFESCES